MTAGCWEPLVIMLEYCRILSWASYARVVNSRAVDSRVVESRSVESRTVGSRAVDSRAVSSDREQRNSVIFK